MAEVKSRKENEVPGTKRRSSRQWKTDSLYSTENNLHRERSTDNADMGDVNFDIMGQSHDQIILFVRDTVTVR